MPVTVVVGGQFGSEGKGKVAHYLVKNLGARYAVRCGGSNSGHTVVDENGKSWIFRHLPTAAILPNVKLAICAGSYIDMDVLQNEMASANITPERLIIDPEAVIITEEYKNAERDSGLVQNIGSTGSGTGAAVANRVLRKKTVVFAKSQKALFPYMGHVSSILRKSLDKNERIVIEGTQGFGLSLLHSGFYPMVTSRDTTAAAFISEAGLSPLDVDDIALVIRAFPIRVAGNSGPLDNETSWEKITLDGQFKHSINEKTSVTHNTRRVAYFSPEIVRKAINVNRPTKIFLNHLDYLNSDPDSLYEASKMFIDNIENELQRKINYIGFSPSQILPKEKYFGGADA